MPSNVKRRASNLKRKTSNVTRTINAYDHTAARYAARDVYPLERELARFLQMLPSGGLTLDVGCGPGWYTRALVARGLRVVGLDLSPGMLHQAQVSGTSRLVCADMEHLPVATGSAAGCFACASLLHLPRDRVPQALAEFRRVLCPGGALYVGLKEGEGEEWVACGEGCERFFVYYRPAEIDRLILAAGFEIVDGWIAPPGQGQQHNWINRFAAAH